MTRTATIARAGRLRCSAPAANSPETKHRPACRLGHERERKHGEELLTETRFVMPRETVELQQQVKAYGRTAKGSEARGGELRNVAAERHAKAF